mgnify:CR=1 FL=1
MDSGGFTDHPRLEVIGVDLSELKAWDSILRT